MRNLEVKAEREREEVGGHAGQDLWKYIHNAERKLREKQ
jgi:hypothetical protein